VRVTIPAMNWEAYVSLAFDEIRLAGASSPQVTRRLAAALDDLSTIAPIEREPPLLTQRQLLLDTADHDDRPRRDSDFALTPDPQGIGVNAGATATSETRTRRRTESTRVN
jgi:uncharacterized membrane protein